MLAGVHVAFAALSNIKIYVILRAYSNWSIDLLEGDSISALHESGQFQWTCISSSLTDMFAKNIVRLVPEVFVYACTFIVLVSEIQLEKSQQAS